MYDYKQEDLRVVRKTKAETEATRKLIIDAARREFAARGVSRTSLEQIAASAGLTRGAIYWHFQNKVDLFIALRDDVVLPLVGRLESALDLSQFADPLDAIEDYLLAHFQRLESDLVVRETFEVMMLKCEYTSEFGELLRCAMDRTQHIFVKLEGAYRAAAGAGALREDLDPVATASDTYVFLIGAIRLWIADVEETGLRRTVAAMVHAHMLMRRRPAAA
ncbi:TetR family transcriptional regulator [Niveibacterium sp. SC-1]|uniref:TetR family transcriptional regulator n=1 Tax=Niveibacterium sp. SC-1 TaxID=3135646 RepID=UPI003120018B